MLSFSAKEIYKMLRTNWNFFIKAFKAFKCGNLWYLFQVHLLIPRRSCQHRDGELCTSCCHLGYARCGYGFHRAATPSTHLLGFDKCVLIWFTTIVGTFYDWKWIIGLKLTLYSIWLFQFENHCRTLSIFAGNVRGPAVFRMDCIALHNTRV